jgi:hypothetical protein
VNQRTFVLRLLGQLDGIRGIPSGRGEDRNDEHDPESPLAAGGFLREMLKAAGLTNIRIVGKGESHEIAVVSRPGVKEFVASASIEAEKPMART